MLLVYAVNDSHVAAEDIADVVKYINDGIYSLNFGGGDGSLSNRLSAINTLRLSNRQLQAAITIINVKRIHSIINIFNNISNVLRNTMAVINCINQ